MERDKTLIQCPHTVSLNSYIFAWVDATDPPTDTYVRMLKLTRSSFDVNNSTNADHEFNDFHDLNPSYNWVERYVDS